MMRLIQPWCLCLLFPAAALAEPPPAPTEQAVKQVVDALRHCRTEDPAQVIDANSVAMLEYWLDAAAHARVEGDLTDYLSIYEQRALKHLRIQGSQADLSDAFRSWCLSTEWVHLALQQLQHQSALVHAEWAWIPLLDAQKDYYGLGVALVYQDGRWVTWLNQSLELDFIPETAAGRRLWQSFQSDQPYWSFDDDEDELVSCPTGSPTGLLTWTEAEAKQAFEAQWERESVQAADDETNILGYLQRRAMERYAMGREVATSPTALSLQAAATMHSAFFPNGPGTGSVAWRDQILRAVTMLRQAEALGAAMKPAAGLIRFAGMLQLTGQGAFAVDPIEGKALLAWAARLGDIDAIGEMVKFESYGLIGEAIDCGKAVRRLEANVAEGYWDDVETTARILSQCPVAEQRDGKRALALIEEYMRRTQTFSWMQQDVAQAQAAARCQLAREQALLDGTEAVDGCPEPTPEHDPSQYLAQLHAAKMARDEFEVESRYDSPPFPRREDQHSRGSRHFSCTLPL